MKLKCKCGEDRLFVTEEQSCDDCKYNGFSISDEITKQMGLEKNPYYFYDEETNAKAEKLLGHEVLRTQTEEEGFCKLGKNDKEGCYLFECSKCGEIIDYIPLIREC